MRIQKLLDVYARHICKHVYMDVKGCLFSVLRLALEKDNLEKESRDKETKILNLTRNLDESQERIEQLERLRQQQARELEDLVSSKDDVGKNVSTVQWWFLLCWSMKGRN